MLAGGMWRLTGSLETGRAQHTATLLPGGRVLVAGGQTSDTGAATATAERFDPATETWAPAGSMATARWLHTATRLADDRVLVTGGRGPSGATSSAELFSPAASPATAWAAGPSLATARSGHTATGLADGRVLVAGGLDASGQPSGSVEVFDPAAGGGAGVFSPGPPLALARSQHVATPLLDGRVLVMGGNTCAAAPPAACPTATAEIFDPAANGGAGAWRSAPSAGGARFDHVATRLADGRVLVVGGSDGFGLPKQTTELFQPSGEPGWSFENPMRIGRVDFASSLLPDGRVLVTGGGDGDTIDEDTSEIWNPATKTWGPTGPLTRARHGHTITTLVAPGCRANCGKVLLAGGVRNLPGDYLRSAELYDPNPAAAGPPPPPPMSPVSPPGAVRDLSARALSSSRVQLTFSASGSPPARGYVVKQARRRIASADDFTRARSLCGGVCQLSPRTAGERLTLTVTGLRARSRYFYALRARGEDRRLYPMSNVAVVTTRARPPGRVRGLRVRAVSPTRIRLVFRATGAPPARHYVIKQAGAPVTSARRFRRARSLCGGLCRFRPGMAGGRLELVITGLRPATRYCYAVRARSGRRLAPRSRTACARTRRSR